MNSLGENKSLIYKSVVMKQNSTVKIPDIINESHFLRNFGWKSIYNWPFHFSIFTKNLAISTFFYLKTNGCYTDQRHYVRPSLLSWYIIIMVSSGPPEMSNTLQNYQTINPFNKYVLHSSLWYTSNINAK